MLACVRDDVVVLLSVGVFIVGVVLGVLLGR